MVKPQTPKEAMKHTREKTTVEVAKDEVALENETRVNRGEEKMSVMEQRRRQAEIYERMQGINREDRD